LSSLVSDRLVALARPDLMLEEPIPAPTPQAAVLTLAEAKAGPRERRAILALCAVIVAVALALIPVAAVPLVPAPEFVAFHVAGVVVTETITAFLLFGQFWQSRTPSLLVLAAAYLFTAPITLAHLLAFPSMNPGQGRLIGGPHSSAWLWLLWHGGFALLVLAYVLVDWRWQGRQIGRGVAGRAITTTCAAVLLAVLGMTVLATRGSFLLPPLLDEHVSPNRWFHGLVIGAIVITTAAFLGLRLIDRGRTILNLWLKAALAATAGDLVLTLFCETRFTVGWFGGRLIGLIASSVLLLLFLREFSRLYRRLGEALIRLRTANDDLERRVADRTAALEVSNAQLARVAAGRSLLLKEVYHRVKNNLQLLDSLVTLQARRLVDPDAREALLALRSRIHTLGLVHQQLMAADNLETFGLAPFLRDLAANVAAAAGAAERRITVTSEVAPVMAGLDLAIPLGLLTTELLLNALKHAFPDGTGGTIVLRLERGADESVRLTVTDDGRGLGEGGSSATSGSRLGTRIMQALVAQLGGELQVRTDRGTTIEVVAPLPAEA
jgi:two-component sensor histidine kinase